MPDSDPNELYEEFLRYKLSQGTKNLDHIVISEVPERKPTSTGELYNPDGTLNLAKVLKKAGNPSVLLALVVSATNLYMEYEQMKTTVAKQKEDIAELRKELDHYKGDSEILLEKTRERFRANEAIQHDLQTAISNVQTEIRIRHGVETYIPEEAALERPPSRSEQLRLLDQDTHDILKRAKQQTPSNDPLEGLEF